MIVVATLLRATAVALRWIAQPFILLGWAAAWVAVPLVWSSDRCRNRAREWDPRLWERGEHTDLRPPPGL